MTSTGEKGGRHGTFLDLPAGQWWAPDGRLRMTVVSVSDEDHSGWVWVEGWCHDVGSEETEWARVPVRVEALPPGTMAARRAATGDAPPVDADG